MEWKIRHSCFTFDLPKIMGVLNLTPDSFSDGGKYLDPQKALEHALQMEADGADVIDIGAESTRPGSREVDADEEWRRLEVPLSLIVSRVKIPISIDTRHPATARRALDSGAKIINDVSCASEPQLLRTAAEFQAGYILMHSRGTPQNMHEKAVYLDLMSELVVELKAGLDRALQHGISLDHILIDPGFGFAKSSEHNWELLARLEELTRLERPLLVGVSRKRFVRELMGEESIKTVVSASIATGIRALQSGASMLRVHDVKETKMFLEALQSPSDGIQKVTLH